MTPESNVEDRLNSLFGDYKAEWLQDRIFDLFTAPEYLPDLTTARPCVLVGGRGTGKTTVLRGLSYEGQFALKQKAGESPEDIMFFGIYYRVNTNRVTAFRGEELPLDDWVRLFGHYLNLLLVDAALRFLNWYQLYLRTEIVLPDEDVVLLGESLHLQDAPTLQALSAGIRRAQVRFEAYINNVFGDTRPSLSMQGAPLDILFTALKRLPLFQGKHFSFLIDEYENFEDYQQQVLNTLIKHSGQLYTFKIGLKEMGWRRRTTLNVNEQLVSPADYAYISITERLSGQLFQAFALDVCKMRLAQLEKEEDVDLDPRRLLPGLSEEQEAEQLGVEQALANLLSSDDVAAKLALELRSKAGLSRLEIYFLVNWAIEQNRSIRDLLADFLDNPLAWKARIGNYQHSMLFAIRSGKVGIRKYYSGWDTFTLLADGNIRYLLELLDQSLLLWMRTKRSLREPVSPETQTEAAQAVGKKNLGELEGLSVHGAQLTKLLLGLGRVFQVMAAEPMGHAPEINQFHLESQGSSEHSSEVETLLKAAVMHLALVRAPGNKPGDESETRDYEYMMHPIFAPFFVFSARRKRKMNITALEILGLVHEPKLTIRNLLKRHNRTQDSPLPEQASLFEAYYA